MRVVEGPLPERIAAMLMAPDQETALAYAEQIAAGLPRLQVPVAEFHQALRREAWQADEDIENVKLRLRAQAVYLVLAEFLQKFTASTDDETVESLVPGWKLSRQLREKFGLNLEGGWNATDDQLRGLAEFADELRPYCTDRQAELLQLLRNVPTVAAAARIMRIEPATGRSHLRDLRKNLQAMALRTTRPTRKRLRGKHLAITTTGREVKP